jgi:hypothetical protein
LSLSICRMDRAANRYNSRNLIWGHHA